MTQREMLVRWILSPGYPGRLELKQEKQIGKRKQAGN